MAEPAAPSEAETAAGFVASDFEFLEFYNAGEVTIDLSGLRFTDGIEFDFADATQATTIPAGHCVPPTMKLIMATKSSVSQDMQ